MYPTLYLMAGVLCALYATNRVKFTAFWNKIVQLLCAYARFPTVPFGCMQCVYSFDEANIIHLLQFIEQMLG